MTLTIEEVRATVADTIGVEPASIDPHADREAVSGWDSLAHLQVVTAFETRFGIRLTMDQISSIRTVADFAALGQPDEGA